MFTREWKSLVVVLASSLLGLGLLGGLYFTGTQSIDAASLLHVDDDNCPANGSGTAEDPYCTIQSAVDAASDLDEIRVAAGTYTGTTRLTAQNSNVYTQVVLIDRKSITIIGGYNSTDWSAEPNPTANPTIIDAQRSGRGMTVLGLSNNEVTLDGLKLTGGDYTGQGNPSGQSNKGCFGTGFDCGGGMRAEGLRLILRDMVIYNNIAGVVDSSRSTQGGGLDARQLKEGSKIVNSAFISNTAGGTSGYGGGIHLTASDVLIEDTIIEGNHATRSGGGLTTGIAVQARLSRMTIKDNSAGRNGGGVFASQGYCGANVPALTIEDSYLTGNSAATGPAIRMIQAFEGDCSALFTNLILANNSAEGSGSGSAVIFAGNYRDSYQLEMNHITAADNAAPTFLYLEVNDNNTVMTTTLTNILVVSNTFGIAAAESIGELIIDVKSPLMSEVDNEFLTDIGAPLLNVSNQVSGDPKLDDDYHLIIGSAAINAGDNSAGVPHDIDGDLRSATTPDIGADEWIAYLYLPLLHK